MGLDNQAYSGVEAGGVTVLPEPVIQKVVGWVSCKRAMAPRFQMHGSETISTTRRNRQGPDSSLRSPWIFVYTRRSLTDSHSVIRRGNASIARCVSRVFDRFLSGEVTTTLYPRVPPWYGILERINQMPPSALYLFVHD